MTEMCRVAGTTTKVIILYDILSIGPIIEILPYKLHPLFEFQAVNEIKIILVNVI